MTTSLSKIKLIITISLLFQTLTLSIIPGTSTIEQYLNAIEASATQSTTTTTTTPTTTTTTTTLPDSTTSVTTATTWKPIVGPYKLGDFITCLEQNKQDPFGYKEKSTYGNWSSPTCAAEPAKCNRYMDCDLDPTFCNEGDVCDHDDPEVYDAPGEDGGERQIRDSCKMQTLFLPAIDYSKSWAYKCARHEICPVKNESAFYYDRYGAKQIAGRMGCMLSPKRAICCCQYDYCNGQDLFLQYAAFGSPENYPPDLQKLVNIDPGNVVVEYTGMPAWVVLPNWECIHSGQCPYPTTTTTTTTTTTPVTTVATTITATTTATDTATTTLNDVVSARISAKNSEGLFMENGRGYDGTIVSNDGIAMEDVVMISGFFVIAILCCGIGVFIGTKMEGNVAGGMKYNNQFVEYV